MKSKIIGILIVIVILIIIGIVVRGILVKKTPQGGGEEAVVPVNNAEEQGPGEPAVGPVTEEKTPIEIAFDKAKDVEINQAKAKEVDAVLRPVLKNVFDTVDENKETVSGVKMKEEFGPMLTYSFNRELTEVERDAILSGLMAVGYNETEGNTEKVVQVKKDSDILTITFYLNNEQKSGLEVTF